MSVDYVAFGIILDDIVFPDGRTAMAVLGGGGPQTAFGMRLWAEGVGLVAAVGDDLPEPARAWLRESGVDTAGVRHTELPTLRAWQVMEADGRRTHVWRVPGHVVAAQLARSADHLPPAYRRARGYHFGLHVEEPGLEFAAGLRRLGGQVSIEPFRPAHRPPTPEALRALLGAAEVFSPNLAGAVSLVGQGDSRELVRRLLEAGAGLVALRMAAQGSLVAGKPQGYRIPAYPVQVLNPVGAGNAYCGGFLVGWVETRDPATAGLYGAVAASLLLEQIGVPAVTSALRSEARRRFEILRAQVEPVRL